MNMNRVKGLFLTPAFGSVLTFMLGSVSLGIAIAFPSPVSIRMVSDLGYTPAELGLFGAITSLTAILGPLVTTPALKFRGRKFTCHLICGLNIFAYSLLLAASESRRMIPIVHRAISGVVAGCFSAVIPLFIMEYANSETRNVYGTMHQFGITFGIIFVNGVGPFIPWKTLAILAIIPSMLLIVLVSRMSDPPVRFGRMPLQETVTNDTGVCAASYRRSSLIAFFLMFFQQVSGINAVLTNFEDILQLATGPVIAASAQFLGVVAALLYVDKLGRRKTWLISCIGSAVAMYILAWDQQTRLDAGITIAAAFMFMFFFCFGLGPIPHYMIPVLFPEIVRSMAGGVFSSVNWFTSFVVILVYPNLVATIGSDKTMLVFLMNLILAAVFGALALGPQPQDDDRLLRGEDRDEALGDAGQFGASLQSQ